MALFFILIVALILQLIYPIAGNILLSLGIIGVILIYLLQSRKQDHSKILAEFIKEGDSAKSGNYRIKATIQLQKLVKYWIT